MSNGNRIRENIDGTTRFTSSLSTGAGGLPIFIYVTGTWEGKLTIQYRLPGDTEFASLPTDEYTENFDAVAEQLPINTEIRVGFVVSGDHISGEAAVTITK